MRDPLLLLEVPGFPDSKNTHRILSTIYISLLTNALLVGKLLL